MVRARQKRPQPIRDRVKSPCAHQQFETHVRSGRRAVIVTGDGRHPGSLQNVDTGPAGRIDLSHVHAIKSIAHGSRQTQL